MFVLKSLGRLILGNLEQQELIQLEDGEVWQLDSKSDHISRSKRYYKPFLDVRFERATLTLRRGRQSFQYELVISDGSKDPLVFGLEKNSSFERYTNNGHTAFSWIDGKRFEYIISKHTSSATIEMFHVTLAQCLFEVIYEKSYDQASDQDLQSIIEKDAVFSSSQGELFFETKDSVAFYVFDAKTNMFMPKSSDVKVFLRRTFASEFCMTLIQDDVLVHSQKLDPDATLHTDRNTCSFIWCYFAPDGFVWTFSLRFVDSVSLMAFSNAMGQAIYEIINEEKFSKLAAEDASYILSPFMEDVEMKSQSESDQDVDKNEGQEESDTDIGSEEQADENVFKGNEKYSHLAVGYKNDRSFVSRGNSIGVFKHTEDDRLKYHATIDRVQTSKGESFNPSKMMLHQEDRSLLLMNPDDEHSLYRMDLECGKIVDQWQIHPDAPITNMIPDSKYAQMTPAQTLIGLNSNSIFRIDPRLPNSKRVDKEMKQYVVKNKFSCGATTGKGELAVASEKGEIRLFNRLDRRAKTLLPGFGDPIIGIDVTESGKYIVATCRSYLLLISTEIPGQDVLGFTRSMGSEKQAPKRLQLKPEHVAFMGGRVSFTPARFSTGQSEEKSIIASTGPYVITWSLRRLKQGKLFDYQIKKYADEVVADNFRFGQDRSIVVTLPHHVTMISKTSLSAPSPKAFLSTPRKICDVVDSPF